MEENTSIDIIDINSLTKLPDDVKEMVCRGRFNILKLKDTPGLILVVSSDKYVNMSYKGEWLGEIDPESVSDDKIESFVEVEDPKVSELIATKISAMG